MVSWIIQDKFWPIWTSLDKFEQVWTSLDKCKQFRTSLEKNLIIWSQYILYCLSFIKIRNFKIRCLCGGIWPLRLSYSPIGYSMYSQVSYLAFHFSPDIQKKELKWILNMKDLHMYSKWNGKWENSSWKDQYCRNISFLGK